MMTPVHKMAAVFSTRAARLPSTPSMERMEPPARLMATTPMQEMTTSTKTKQARPMGH